MKCYATMLILVAIAAIQVHRVWPLRRLPKPSHYGWRCNGFDLEPGTRLEICEPMSYEIIGRAPYDLRERDFGIIYGREATHFFDDPVWMRENTIFPYCIDARGNHDTSPSCLGTGRTQPQEEPSK